MAENGLANVKNDDTRKTTKNFFHTHTHTSVHFGTHDMTKSKVKREKKTRRKKVISFLDSSSCINIVCCVVKCRSVVSFVFFWLCSQVNGILWNHQKPSVLNVKLDGHIRKKTTTTTETKHLQNTKRKTIKKKIWPIVSKWGTKCVSCRRYRHNTEYYITFVFSLSLFLPIWTGKRTKWQKINKTS